MIANSIVVIIAAGLFIYGGYNLYVIRALKKTGVKTQGKVIEIEKKGTRNANYKLAYFVEDEEIKRWYPYSNSLARLKIGQVVNMRYQAIDPTKIIIESDKVAGVLWLFSMFMSLAVPGLVLLIMNVR